MQITDEQRATVGAVVRRARTARRLSIENMASQARMSPVTWTKVEAGEPVRLATYDAVERALDWKPGTIEDLAVGRTIYHGDRQPANEANFTLVVTRPDQDHVDLVDLALALKKPDSVKVDLIWVLKSGRNPIDAALGLDRDDHHKVEVIAALREVEAQADDSEARSAS